MADRPIEDHPIAATFAKIAEVGVLSAPEVKERVEAFLEKIGVCRYDTGEIVEYRDNGMCVAWALKLEGSKGPIHISTSGDQIIFYKTRWEAYMCKVDSIYGRPYAIKCGLEIERATDAPSDTS